MVIDHIGWADITRIPHEKVNLSLCGGILLMLLMLSQLNFVHRMTARVVFVLLWVHAGAKVGIVS